ncbi:DNA-directed RNA polymerase subunit A' [Candidatus Micrarchaeota archaeon]|nr:DNA-directed RNA polymerase subunit A' [Candidatus Micrarchaeota archaeon]
MKVIGSIQFTLFSPEQFRKMSAAKITVPDTYDEDGYPINGGLADQHLGVIDPGLKCKTCGGRMRDCSGHFGNIELVRPVVHVSFGKTIYQLLRACCRKCGRVMNSATQMDAIVKSSECPHCGEAQKGIKFVKPTSFYEEDRRLLQNEIRERLERIPDEDVRQLGLSIRPEWTVLTVLPVPPVSVRPSITLETGERSEDDLTHKLVDILRINQRLEENIDAGAPQLIIEDLWELLQYHVSTFFDNETAGIPPARHRSGRQLKTLFQRLKGKEGRFRYNLSGKRVNFSARTVISPDPTLGINELGVPESIAQELSIPVSVTEWNIENLKKLIRENPDKISYVVRPDGRRKKLTTGNTEEIITELTSGYLVERQLMNGDIVIFNRQPSLHRISMMCHNVRVLPGKTFRFNVADCRPYNADFDGDEMNIHVPQNEEAQSEAELLMKVSEQIISPRNGEPIIVPELDQVSGLYILTSNDDWTFSRDEACAILNSGGLTAKVPKNGLKAREVYSMLLPEDFNFTMVNKQGDEIKIKNGKLVAGTIDSRASEFIVKKIFTESGSEAARKYLDAATRLSVFVATRFGLSLSLNDYQLPPEARKEIRDIYKQGRSALRELIRKYRSKKLERQPGKTMRETLEEQIMDVVEKIRFKCWKTVKLNIKREKVKVGRDAHAEIEHNNALMMASAGAKGKPTNVIQMCALVGQQAIRGKRPRAGYKKRILSHFHRGDLGDEARGFVRNSYMHGLTPTEYFFHAAGGRDSVVDKGVNPAKTGYMQRRLVNALQDLIVENDLSVRDSSQRIIQFIYGGDGIDPCNNKQIAYGEAVGILAAQSIGEPGTQMTLRTFHYAGIASLAQLGFTRLVELVDARKTPKKPVMEIYLKGEAKRSAVEARAVAASIEQITLTKVASIQENFNRKVVIITLNRSALREKEISEKRVVEEVKKVSPDLAQDGVEIKIRVKDDSLKNIRRLTNRLREIVLKGVPGINKVIIVEKEIMEKGEKTKELTLASDGSNLREVLKNPRVDAERTTTNDVMEIAEVLGIEAARNAIVLEMFKVLEAQDLKVDYRHVSLIADAMSSQGDIKSAGRHGLAGQKASVLARAAFEETAKHLVNACVYGEEDKLRGVAENIIIGQTIPCGTGRVKLVMQTD